MTTGGNARTATDRQTTASGLQVVPVSVARPGPAQDYRAVKVVLQRELIRFGQDRTRILSALVQPVLFLFVLGTGLSSLTEGSTGGVDLRTFMFPGIVATSTLFTAMFSAVSIVWDREFGFLREMLVAPVSRGAVVVGKCLGGTVVATLQGCVILSLAGLAGVPYAPRLLLTLLGATLLLSFALTAFGLAVAVRMAVTQPFMALMQMFTMPMFFLSGAVFPLADQPAWIRTLSTVNPLTYAVDPMRRAVSDHLSVAPATAEAFGQGVTWGGWEVPVWLELAIVAATGLALLGTSVAGLRRSD